MYYRLIRAFHNQQTESIAILHFVCICEVYCNPGCRTA
jgi:hypothetical protein